MHTSSRFCGAARPKDPAWFSMAAETNVSVMPEGAGATGVKPPSPRGSGDVESPPADGRREREGHEDEVPVTSAKGLTTKAARTKSPPPSGIVHAGTAQLTAMLKGAGAARTESQLPLASETTE